MKREFDVCGLGNAIVDIFLEVSDEEFGELGFDRGTMQLVDRDAQRELIGRFEAAEHDLQLASGGSVANSTIAISQLGGSAAFIGVVGDDRYGMHYAEEFTQLGIDIGNPVLVGETTGTCLALITPDAERTMRTCLGVSSELAARHVERRRVEASRWLFIEGYLFANPATGQQAILEAIRVAKAAGTKVAVTASDAFIPQVFGDALGRALADADLLFCNAAEAMAMTKTDGVQASIDKLGSVVENFVLTDGANGAHIRFGGERLHEPAVPCTPKDLTGAGDMFAGAFLYGITQDVPLRQTARAANHLCMKVITQTGARLHHGVRDAWAEAAGGTG